MHQPNNAFIGHRAEALAKVFLTRRRDVAVLPFEQGDLDLFVSILPEGEEAPHGFMGFGVIVWGTDRPLPTEAAATRHAETRWRAGAKKDKGGTTYFLPVIVLLFSMDNDRGYYAWVTEPRVGEGEGPPKLKGVERPDFTALERDSLDDIVARVKEWYSHLASAILVGPR